MRIRLMHIQLKKKKTCLLGVFLGRSLSQEIQICAYTFSEKKWLKKKKLEKLTETVRHVLSLQQQL